MKNAVVFYPSLGAGHLYSMIELARLLHRRHPNRFSLTVILSGDPSATACLAESTPFITFLHLPPPPVVATAPSPTRSRVATVFDTIRLNSAQLHPLLRRISATSRIAALIIDFFCTSAVDVARPLEIPIYYYFTSSAAALALHLYLPSIHNQVDQSFKDLTDTVFSIPGVPPIPATHMPTPLLDRNDSAYHDLIYFSSQLPKSDGILLNNFDELDQVATAAISSGCCVVDGSTPPIYNIGPLIATKKGNEIEHDECLKWLDSQPNESVVFLCFGSGGLFTAEQLKEIAIGLEKSGHRFLWVVRDPKGLEYIEFDLGKLLPDGFLERVKGKGKVVKNWAPQVAVLSHDAVGGFVTHCGWNSILEAVVAGKPMVGWPLYAEQKVNAAAMAAAMGVELVERGGDGVVGAAEVAGRIRELMESDKGKEMKMREKGLGALGGNGSSTIALNELVKIWDSFDCHMN